MSDHECFVLELGLLYFSIREKKAIDLYVLYFCIKKNTMQKAPVKSASC